MDPQPVCTPLEARSGFHPTFLLGGAIFPITYHGRTHANKNYGYAGDAGPSARRQVTLYRKARQWQGCAAEKPPGDDYGPTRAARTPGHHVCVGAAWGRAWGLLSGSLLRVLTSWGLGQGGYGKGIRA